MHHSIKPYALHVTYGKWFLWKDLQVWGAAPVCGLLHGEFGCCYSIGCLYVGQSFSGNHGSCWWRCGCSSRSGGDTYCTPYGPVKYNSVSSCYSKYKDCFDSPVSNTAFSCCQKLLFWKGFRFKIQQLKINIQIQILSGLISVLLEPMITSNI